MNKLLCLQKEVIFISRTQANSNIKFNYKTQGIYAENGIYALCLYILHLLKFFVFLQICRNITHFRIVFISFAVSIRSVFA